MNRQQPNFSIKKSYNAKLLHEQSKYIAYNENGEKIVYHNPIDGVGDAKSKPVTGQPTAKVAPSFKMRKTIYSVTDK